MESSCIVLETSDALTSSCMALIISALLCIEPDMRTIATAENNIHKSASKKGAIQMTKYICRWCSLTAGDGRKSCTDIWRMAREHPFRTSPIKWNFWPAPSPMSLSVPFSQTPSPIVVTPCVGTSLMNAPKRSFVPCDDDDNVFSMW